MATIKYLLQSKSKNAPIYLRLSLNRTKSLKRKTELYINPNQWSKTKGYPIAKDANTKDIKSKLEGLKAFVLREYNKDHSEGGVITGDWLLSKINARFNRKEKTNLEHLINYSNQFLENLPYRVTNKGNKGVSIATLKKYKSVINKLKEFEKYRKKRILIKEVNLRFRDELIKYFIEVDELGENTTGRYIKVVKTICLDAKRNGIETHDQLANFKGFTVTAPKVILSIEELEQIENTKFVKPELEIAKDWLIIGFYTGQRVSDLLRMNKSFIQTIQDFEFIVLEQVKTKKTVQIPLHNEVREILKKQKKNRFLIPKP